jgi:hypothetical protein
VVERQVAEEHVLLADLREGEGAHEALADDVAMAEADPLGRAVVPEVYITEA